MAGIIFLLPILVLVVLFTKIFQFLTGFTNKIAALFGLKSFVGVSGGTIVGAVSLILFCLLCGYLVRIAFFKAISKWVDRKLMANIPGYSIYREMALSKLEDHDKALPFESVVWVKRDAAEQPGFLMETMPDGRLVIFFPTAGKTLEGEVIVIAADQVRKMPETDMKAMKIALDNLGIGLSKIPTR
ncbi:DUF502 domain-containing protein [Flavobacterium caeni]|uniref:Uncharacterized membrane protein n=1 Tax=Flavobacterium caeni TaxID=490189 RepID=A0A1G5CYB0_9FLAO|nr:DUF502 domain-containing protein [Flavobacterium caeni]SCY07238.1 Uncharacterized membrane protein [Flavobacterium caeni]